MGFNLPLQSNQILSRCFGDMFTEQIAFTDTSRRKTTDSKLASHLANSQAKKGKYSKQRANYQANPYSLWIIWPVSSSWIACCYTTWFCNVHSIKNNYNKKPTATLHNCNQNWNSYSCHYLQHFHYRFAHTALFLGILDNSSLHCNMLHSTHSSKPPLLTFSKFTIILLSKR